MTNAPPPSPAAPRRSRRPALLSAAVAIAVLATFATLVVRRSGDDAVSNRRVSASIGAETVSVAANQIRFADQRRGGDLPRLDLALLWPGLTGLTEATRPAFAALGADASIVQIAIEPRAVDLDSAARLASVYLRFLAPKETEPEETGREAPPPIDGLVARRFLPTSPYADETLYFEPGSVHPFVARCFARAAGDTRRLCLTELSLGRHLVAAARFPPALLADWRRLGTDLRTFLDDAVR